MATPRIFVSSTCYDLQEIRFQLRSFIREYGYEAVLSEFDDIFYNYNKHVQDSCLEEIPKCQLFILVIGNNYGSFYHKEQTASKTPDSVTLREFRRALDHNISKHLFVNKYVDYDYKNYKRALEKYILAEFQQRNSISEEEAITLKNSLKDNFHKIYHFPQDSYRYIFYFLDIVYELNEGNSVSTFESFADIKESLKKQWAGLIYEALVNKKQQESKEIRSIEKKIDHIERNISKLLNSKTSQENGQLSFNIQELIKDVNLGDLEKIQEKVQSVLWNLCNIVKHDFNDQWTEKRFTFSKPMTIDSAKLWLDDLGSLIKNYKWSQFIKVDILFSKLALKSYQTEYSDIEYKQILDLYNIYSSLATEEKNSFVHTIYQALKDNYDNGPSNGVVKVDFSDEMDDDLPF